MKDVFFSIMVPVYNVEKYLHQCIDSVLQQDYTNYELILIDDGSTDNSGAICDSYEKNDRRIKVFHKQNEGLLLTRRYGLKKANNDWLMFLDSDDYWEPGLLQCVVDTIHNNQPDMVIFNHQTVSDSGKLLKKHEAVFPDGYIITENNKDELYREVAKGKRLNSIWRKVVHRSIACIDMDFSQYKDKKGEDILQSIYMFEKAKKVVYRDFIGCNYRLSKTGRGRNFKIKYIDDAETVAETVYEILQRSSSDERIPRLFLKRYLQKIADEIVKLLNAYSQDQELVKSSIDRVKGFPIYLKAIETVDFSELDRKTRWVLKQLIKDRLALVKVYVAFEQYPRRVYQALRH